MTEFLITLDGSPLGFARDEGNGVGLIQWFHANAGGQSMDYYTTHGGYGVEELPDGLAWEQAATLLPAIMQRAGITIESTFVPFSQSRNKGEKSPTLNWRITVKHHGRVIIEGVDYSAGFAHCPCYKRLKLGAKGGRLSVDDAAAVAWETEKGTAAPRAHSMPIGGKPILPDPVDVMGSLLLDSDVLDFADFEAFAEEFGYDSDSRKAESIYRQCIETATKLRAAFGGLLLSELSAVAAGR